MWNHPSHPAALVKWSVIFIALMGAAYLVINGAQFDHGVKSAQNEAVPPATRLAAEEKYPANALVRTGGIRKPFTGIGSWDLVGCRDPANTLLWLSIITGKLYEREVRDGTRRTLIPATDDQVWRGYADHIGWRIAKNQSCKGYEDGDQVVVQAE